MRKMLPSKVNELLWPVMMSRLCLETEFGSWEGFCLETCGGRIRVLHMVSHHTNFQQWVPMPCLVTAKECRPRYTHTRHWRNNRQVRSLALWQKASARQ